MKCLTCDEDIDPIKGLLLHPTCEINPDILATELFQIIEASIVNQPRSLQKSIGPSEVGTLCDRRLGFGLADIPKVNDRGVPWKPFVGTALHEQMANIIARNEVGRFDAGIETTERWKVEERVSVGEIGTKEITGSCDLFDVHNGAVWDWKFTTKNQIRENYRSHGPGQQYRTQAHLYGRGFARQGYAVRTVGVIFMTRDGEFSDRHVWHEPYDEQVAIDGLARVSSIANALNALGPDFTIPTLATADAYCNFCPWFKRMATQLGQACPGHNKENTEIATLTQLIGA